MKEMHDACLFDVGTYFSSFVQSFIKQILKCIRTQTSVSYDKPKCPQIKGISTIPIITNKILSLYYYQFFATTNLIYIVMISFSIMIIIMPITSWHSFQEFCINCYSSPVTRPPSGLCRYKYFSLIFFFWLLLHNLKKAHRNQYLNPNQ